MKMEESASRACRRLTIAPLLALALLGRPPLAHATGAITSITPACAATGSDVVITGRGFGAPNVTITVGGVPAQVLNATGYRVTFVVPAGMPSGVTAVKSMNPGGLTGSSPFASRDRKSAG